MRSSVVARRNRRAPNTGTASPLVPVDPAQRPPRADHEAARPGTRPPRCRARRRSTGRCWLPTARPSSAETATSPAENRREDDAIAACGHPDAAVPLDASLSRPRRPSRLRRRAPRVPHLFLGHRPVLEREMARRRDACACRRPARAAACRRRTCRRRSAGSADGSGTRLGGLSGLGTSPSSTIGLRDRPRSGSAIGHGREQRTRVRMLRLAVELVARRRARRPGRGT